MVFAYQACRDVAGTSREEAKLGRPPGWNLVRAERSRLCVYAFVQRTEVDGIEDKHNDRKNTCDSLNCLRSITSDRRHKRVRPIAHQDGTCLSAGRVKGILEDIIHQENGPRNLKWLGR